MSNKKQSLTSSSEVRRLVRRMKAGDRLVITAKENKTTVRINSSCEIQVEPPEKPD